MFQERCSAKAASCLHSPLRARILVKIICPVTSARVWLPWEILSEILSMHLSASTQVSAGIFLNRKAFQFSLFEMCGWICDHRLTYIDSITHIHGNISNKFGHAGQFEAEKHWQIILIQIKILTLKHLLSWVVPSQERNFSDAEEACDICITHRSHGARQEIHF